MNKFFSYGTLMAGSTALISGISIFFNKIAVSGFQDPFVFTAVKNSITAIFLIGIVLLLGKWREIRSLKPGQIRKLLLIGLIGGFLPFLLFYKGLTQTSALNANIIHKTLFIWVLIFGLPFLKEKVSFLQWIGIIFIALANFMIGGFKGFKYNAGELMILAAAILWAIENIIAKVALKTVSSQVAAASRMAIGSFFLLSLLLIQGKTDLIFNLAPIQWLQNIFLSFLLLGYVLCWYTALKHAPATFVAAVLAAATLPTNILSAIFVSHSFDSAQFLTSIFYLAGLFLIIIFAEKKAKESAAAISKNANLENAI